VARDDWGGGGERERVREREIRNEYKILVGKSEDTRMILKFRLKEENVRV
jgi:hypothetical protein